MQVCACLARCTLIETNFFHACEDVDQDCTVLQAALTIGSAPYVQFDWKPETGSLLHLVPLDGDATKIRHVKAPSYFTFHYINAYETEDGSSINIDFGNFGQPEMLNAMYLDKMKTSTETVCASPLT